MIEKVADTVLKLYWELNETKARLFKLKYCIHDMNMRMVNIYNIKHDAHICERKCS